jgi:CheY-like chemotaxis protein
MNTVLIHRDVTLAAAYASRAARCVSRIVMDAMHVRGRPLSCTSMRVEMDQFASIVLLVDPDARHRAAAALLLKSDGYSVVAVRNAPEALETFDAHHADIALIIADDEVVCPELRHEEAPMVAMAGAGAGAGARHNGHTSAARVNAPSLLAELKRIDACVPVIVMAEDDAAARRRERYRENDLAGVLSKPLRSQELNAVLARRC